MVVIRLVCLGETGEGLDLEVSLEEQSRMRVNDVGPRFGGLKLVGGFYPAVVIGCGEEACLPGEWGRAHPGCRGRAPNRTISAPEAGRHVEQMDMRDQLIQARARRYLYSIDVKLKNRHLN